MELSEFFEQAINSQRDDLLFQDKLTSKNESSLNDYSFSEQLNIIGIYSSKFFNSSDKEDLSSEKEYTPYDTKDISSILPNNEEDDNNIKHQETKIKRKRGRPSLNENQKTHNKKKNDNRLTKIQISYFSFIIVFLNEIMKKMNIKYKFEDFNSEFKKKNKKDFRKNLKNKTIKDIILEMPISIKCSDIDHNKKIYQRLCEENQYIILNILEKNYLYFFENIYYNNCKKFNLRKFDLNDYYIELSTNVKTYIDLLNKKENKELDYKNLLDKCVKKFFLSKEYNINV